MAGMIQKLKNFLTEEEVDETEYRYEENEPETEDFYVEKSPVQEHPCAPRETKSEPIISGNRNVVNIHATTQLQVVLSKPETFGDEIRTVADELIKRRTVVLNLEKTDKDVSRRIIDFLSGVAYAQDGKIKRIATNTFIITPCNVDLLGEDLIDELGNNGVYL